MIKDLNKNSDDTMCLLYHVYEYGDNKEHEDIKILGIYSSETKALEAAERYYKLDGFKRYPKECFEIWEIKVDEDFAWKEGFVSSYEIEQDFELLTICFNEWLGIKKSPQESWENDKYYSVLCDVNKVVYNINETWELAKYIQKIWIKQFGDNNKKFDEYIKIASQIRTTLKLI